MVCSGQLLGHVGSGSTNAIGGLFCVKYVSGGQPWESQVSIGLSIAHLGYDVLDVLGHVLPRHIMPRAHAALLRLCSANCQSRGITAPEPLGLYYVVGVYE